MLYSQPNVLWSSLLYTSVASRVLECIYALIAQVVTDIAYVNSLIKNQYRPTRFRLFFVCLYSSLLTIQATSVGLVPQAILFHKTWGQIHSKLYGLRRIVGQFKQWAAGHCSFILICPLVHCFCGERMFEFERATTDHNLLNFVFICRQWNESGKLPLAQRTGPKTQKNSHCVLTITALATRTCLWKKPLRGRCWTKTACAQP